VKARVIWLFLACLAWLIAYTLVPWGHAVAAAGPAVFRAVSFTLILPPLVACAVLLPAWANLHGRRRVFVGVVAFFVALGVLYAVAFAFGASPWSDAALRLLFSVPGLAAQSAFTAVVIVASSWAVVALAGRGASTRRTSASRCHSDP
jgi:hypothetical protein